MSNTDSSSRLSAALEEYWDSSCGGGLVTVAEYGRSVDSDIRSRFMGTATILEGVREKPIRLEGFVLHNLLGIGASGNVWEATQLAVKRRVALKILHPSLIVDAKSLARFKQESQAVGRLTRSPRIVQVFDSGVDSGHHYIAMELVEGGGTLATAIATRRRDVPLEAKHVRLIVEQVADVARALAAAHDKDVIHRDVKPGNILCAADGSVKLTDFGLAKLLDNATTRTEEGLGTPYYMAPEQIDPARGPLGPAADIWGLGATLYEVLTLHRPFAGDTRDQVSRRILESAPTDPRVHCAAISADLAAVILHCLDPRPERRYQTALELAGDLEAIELGQPVSVRMPGPWQRLLSFVRRNPLRASVATLSVVAAVSVIGLRVSAVRANGRTMMAFQVHERALEMLGASSMSDAQVAEQLRDWERKARDLFGGNSGQLSTMLEECADVALSRGFLEQRAKLLQGAADAGPASVPLLAELGSALLSLERPGDALRVLRGRVEPELQVLELEALLSSRDGDGLDAWEARHGSARDLLISQVGERQRVSGTGSLEVASARLALGQWYLSKGKVDLARDNLRGAYLGVSRSEPVDPRIKLHLQRASYALGILSIIVGEEVPAIERTRAAFEVRAARWGRRDLRTLRAQLTYGWALTIGEDPEAQVIMSEIPKLTDHPGIVAEAERSLYLPNGVATGSYEIKPAVRGAYVRILRGR